MSREKEVQILVDRDKLTWDEAEEFVSYNEIIRPNRKRGRGTGGTGSTAKRLQKFDIAQDVVIIAGGFVCLASGYLEVSPINLVIGAVLLIFGNAALWSDLRRSRGR